MRRAREVDQGFVLTAENAAALTEIVNRLEGLPLAIELAAAHSRLFPPRVPAQGLGEGGRLAGAAEALRATVGGGIKAEASRLPGARATAAQRLDDPRIDRLWEEGQRYGLEEATAHAQEVGTLVLSAARPAAL